MTLLVLNNWAQYFFVEKKKKKSALSGGMEFYISLHLDQCLSC